MFHSIDISNPPRPNILIAFAVIKPIVQLTYYVFSGIFSIRMLRHRLLLKKLQTHLNESETRLHNC